MHELDEKAPSLICKAKKNSADLDSRKMTKSSFMQAHEFEKRRAESHSGIQPSVPLMISHTLSLISEQYEAARALCALNQWQSSRGGTRNSCKSKVEEKLDERRKVHASNLNSVQFFIYSLSIESSHYGLFSPTML
ncbi:uncharacterized protein [Pyrus communis]|uniref:uncharacterized protein isoform X2 n=1 Tax=Pyrus communis TaxID=23211 RepID=UPI0035C1FB27